MKWVKNMNELKRIPAIQKNIWIFGVLLTLVACLSTVADEGNVQPTVEAPTVTPQEPAAIPATASQEAIECIEPAFQLAYPFDTTPVPGQQKDIQMIGWEPQLPDDLDYQVGLHSPSDLVVRNDDELWINSPLMRYTPSTGKIKVYTETEGVLGRPHTLFVSSDDTLWALVRGANQIEQWLIRYDDETDNFVTVNDVNGLFIDGLENQMGMSGAIKEDAAGIFWLLFDDSLVRFDPSTLSSEIVVSEEQGFDVIQRPRSLEIASDGTIWFFARDLADPNIGQRDYNPAIVRYDPDTNEIRSYRHHKFREDIGNFDLLFDHLGSLWIGDYGWYEFDEQGTASWYQIIRSPIFVSENPAMYSQYRWERPLLELETLDRYIWFAGASIVRLDLETEEWCQLTNTWNWFFSIAEDSQHNLWTVGNRQIYKFSQLP